MPFETLWPIVRDELARLGELSTGGLLFGRRELALQLLLALTGGGLGLLLLRAALTPRRGLRNRVAVPAIYWSGGYRMRGRGFGSHVRTR